MKFPRGLQISGMTVFALVAISGSAQLILAKATPGSLAGLPPNRASGYLQKVIATNRTYPPDSLAVDTATCLSKSATEQLESFGWIFRSGVFNKADCLRQLHAYRTKPDTVVYTSVYILSFSRRNLAHAVNRMRKEKLPVFPRLNVSEYYKWHVVDGRLVLLVLDGGPPYELFNHLDTMTVDYLKPAAPPGRTTHE